MKIILVVWMVILIAYSSLSYAKDISLIAHSEEKPKLIKSDEVKPVDSDPALDNFLSEETSRIRNIKLLSLEVEKTDLELKKQMMLARINKLNKSNDAINHQTSLSDQGNASNITVQSVLVSTGISTAIILVNHERLIVSQNDVLPSGIVVKTILPTGIMIKYPDGSLKNIPYTKG